MATQQIPKRWIDEKSDRELDTDTAAAYAEVSKSVQGRSGPCGVLVQIGKLIVTKWLEPPLGSVAKSLKQLIAVPLTPENCTWFYESSLRECIRATLAEDAQSDVNRLNKGPKGETKGGFETFLKQYKANQAARTVMLNAIRIDAGEPNIRRVMNAIKGLKSDSEPPDEED